MKKLSLAFNLLLFLSPLSVLAMGPSNVFVFIHNETEVCYYINQVYEPVNLYFKPLKFKFAQIGSAEIRKTCMLAQPLPFEQIPGRVGQSAHLSLRERDETKLLLRVVHKDGELYFESHNLETSKSTEAFGKIGKQYIVHLFLNGNSPVNTKLIVEEHSGTDSVD